MANGRIDENGLPVYAPGDFDYVRVVDRSTGASRNALVPEVTAAARVLTEKLGEVVADAEADIAPVIAGLGYLPPVPYASGLSVNSTRFTVIREGQVYAPAAPVPFTTGAWDAGQWRLIQGVTGVDLAAPSGAAMVGFRQDAPGAIERSVLQELRDVALTPEQFGAVGDGVTNDTDAFLALAAAVNSRSGGMVRFGRNKTYIVGRQEFAGAEGKGYAYRGLDILHFEDCERPLVVDMNGSVMRWAPGLKFGSFNPVTGAPHNPTMPFMNWDYRADIGRAIRPERCRSVLILNGEIDGNDDEMVIGGGWGDVGRQCTHVGIHLWSVESAILENLELHHHLLDGGASRQPLAQVGDAPKPVELRSVNCHHNGRQGWSWVGGVSFVAVDCRFTETGRGRVFSAPGSGFDIEAENSICRNGLFINCTFADCAGNALVADSGDSADVRFQGCRFYGTTAVSLWVRKPDFVFEDCLISGLSYPGLLDTPDERERPKYIRCRFSDAPYAGRPVYGDRLIDSSQGASFYDCRFEARSPSVRLGAAAPGTNVFTDCRFIQESSPATSVVRGSFFGRNHFQMLSGVNDFNGYRNYGELTWEGNVAAVQGSENRSGAEESPPFKRLGLCGGTGSGFSNTVVTKGAAAPASGAWKRGDIQFNANPAAGAPIGWACISAGTPGVWVPFGSTQVPNQYSPSNLVLTRAFDANSVTTDVLADVVGTLIHDLKQARVLS